MVKVFCSWCQPRRLIHEREPLDDPTEVDSICTSCYQVLMTERGMPAAEIPEELGACEITRVEEEGDVHVFCDEKFYRITADGSEVTEEGPPAGLEPAAVAPVDFVKLAEEKLDEPAQD